MNFNPHSHLAGSHAFLSASKYHWIRYDEDKIDKSYLTSLAARRGDELHEFAHNAIRLGVKLAGKTTLSMYVNDAIGFKMTPEQVLFFSENAFGTADAISFKRNLLRIHDLKTGVTPTSMDQLNVYAAFFCLEYGIKPFDIRMEFRIYQNDAIEIEEGDPDTVTRIMEKTINFDKRIKQIRTEAF